VVVRAGSINPDGRQKDPIWDFLQLKNSFTSFARPGVQFSDVLRAEIRGAGLRADPGPGRGKREDGGSLSSLLPTSLLAGVSSRRSQCTQRPVDFTVPDRCRLVAEKVGVSASGFSEDVRSIVVVPSHRAGTRGRYAPPLPRRTSLRSQLYRAARDLGNVEAAEKGPSAYGKRIVRRRVYRTTNKITGSFLRRWLK
jgi:hypothetical protein